MAKRRNAVKGGLLWEHEHKHERVRYEGVVAILIVLSFLCGCAERRYYPVCVYGSLPGIRSTDDLKSRLQSFVKVAAGKKAKMELAPSNRLVVIKASRQAHSRLASAWPRTACIGPGRDEEEYQYYKECVDLLSLTLQKHDGLLPLGDWSDGQGVTLYCAKTIDQTPRQ
jgi:hypothetical protein